MGFQLMILLKMKSSEGADFQNLTKRLQGQFIKQGMSEAGKLWHVDIRPKHFTNRGATEYGYRPRQGERGSGGKFNSSYTARKLRKFGHTRPLEYTGETKRMSRIVRVVNTSKSVKLRYSLRKLDFVQGARDEFSRFSEADEQLIVNTVDKSIQKQLDELPKKAI